MAGVISAANARGNAVPLVIEQVTDAFARIIHVGRNEVAEALPELRNRRGWMERSGVGSGARRATEVPAVLPVACSGLQSDE
jgi:hypothetical protein